MARLIAGFDWSSTSLGPINDWLGHLMTPVMLMLQTPFPIAILWGTEGVILYNDAFAEFSGSRHPGMLGMPVREAWPEPVEMNASVLQ